MIIGRRSIYQTMVVDVKMMAPATAVYSCDSDHTFDKIMLPMACLHDSFSIFCFICYKSLVDASYHLSFEIIFLLLFFYARKFLSWKVYFVS